MKIKLHPKRRVKKKLFTKSDLLTVEVEDGRKKYPCRIQVFRLIVAVRMHDVNFKATRDAAKMMYETLFVTKSNS